MDLETLDIILIWLIRSGEFVMIALGLFIFLNEKNYVDEIAKGTNEYINELEERVKTLEDER